MYICYTDLSFHSTAPSLTQTTVDSNEGGKEGSYVGGQYILIDIYLMVRTVK